MPLSALQIHLFVSKYHFGTFHMSLTIQFPWLWHFIKSSAPPRIKFTVLGEAFWKALAPHRPPWKDVAFCPLHQKFN